MNQNKTALNFVFERLGDLPMPKEEFYGKVFRNYDREGKGLIDFRSFQDIVIQWDEHHLEKLRQNSMADESQLHRSKAAPRPVQSPSARDVTAACQEDLMSWPSPTASSGNFPDTPGSGGGGGGPAPRNEPGFDAGSPPANDRREGPVAVANDGSDRPAPTFFPLENARATATGSAGSGRSGAVGIVSNVMFPTYVGRLAIFDDYEFCGDVGHGSFGKVLVVRHRHTSMLRACKVVAVSTALQWQLIETEISLLKSLNHPNIMTLYEVYSEEGHQERVTNGNIYLVTELCEGGDLFSRILHHYEKLKQPMTESHVAFMMQQILSATKYCHNRGIVHRDMKPENILFVDRSPQSSIKIIDFGLANFTTKIRETAKEVTVPRSDGWGMLARLLPSVGGKNVIPREVRKQVMQRAGTAHYMAPEMIQGCYDQKADIFSIGIIFSQLLTGWHPFYVPRVDDEQSVKRKIVSEDPVEFAQDVWTFVSAEAQDLCRALLEKFPDRRPSAEQALVHAWFKDPAKLSPFGNMDGLSVSVFDGLRMYQSYNKLKRAVLQLLTRELSEYQIQELRRKFMALDTQGDGLISTEELVDGMRHVGYDMSRSELEGVMVSLSVSGQNRVGYKEFISALIERRVKFDHQQLQECFKKFDTTNSGRITYEDVKRVLLSSDNAPAITESEWEEIAVPHNGKVGSQDGCEITFDEFVALMDRPT